MIDLLTRFLAIPLLMLAVPLSTATLLPPTWKSTDDRTITTKQDFGIAVGTDAGGNVYTLAILQETRTIKGVVLPTSGFYIFKHSFEGIRIWKNKIEILGDPRGFGVSR